MFSWIKSSYFALFARSLFLLLIKISLAVPHSNVVSVPRLGSFLLKLLAKKLRSAWLAQYPKKLVLRKFVKTSLFSKNFVIA